MILYPAIDIIDGKPVRLTRGDYATSHQVAEDVIETARSFEKDGAVFLHLVDLDGAKAGRPVNNQLIARTASSLSIPIEVGGGIRSLEDITWYLSHGIERVILGTAAATDPDLLKEAIDTYPGRIVVGLDADHGKVRLSGWLKDSGLDMKDFARDMKKAGIDTLICTDISRDGTMKGPSLEMLEEISKCVNINLVASGGIRDLEDLRNLEKMNISGAVLGKSLYSGSLNLEEAVKEFQC